MRKWIRYRKRMILEIAILQQALYLEIVDSNLSQSDIDIFSSCYKMASMRLSIENMREHWQLIKDAEVVEDCILDLEKRAQFHDAFNRVGWDVDKMRDVIRFACNCIPQSDPHPAISFDAYTL